MIYYIVNSFTNKPFLGNPAGVIVVENFPTTRIMQNVAKQLNLVETVFIKVINKNSIKIKYFTPLKELPIAGHPTIAGLRVLYELKKINQGSINVITNSKTYEGIVKVTQSQVVCSLKFCNIEHKAEIKDKELVAKVLGLTTSDLTVDLPIKVVNSGLGYIVVPVVSLNALNKVKRNISELKQLCTEYGAREAQVFTFETLSNANHLHTRNICPREGIEDPACGVGNAALLSYLAYEANKVGQYRIEQGYISNFQSLIIGSSTEKDCVLVGGNAIIMSKGELYL